MSNLINWCGFETGDGQELYLLTGTAAVVAGGKKGNYGLRTQQTSAQTGYAQLGVYNSTNYTNYYLTSNSPVLGCWFMAASLPTGEEDFAGTKTSGGTLAVHLRIDNTGTVRAYKSDGTLLGTSITRLQPGVWYFIELRNRRVAPYGATLRINDAVEFDTSSYDNTTPAYAICGRMSVRNASAVDFCYDDMYWGQDDFQGSRLTSALLPLTGNGTDIGWLAGTGASDYTQIDEIPFSYADYIACAATGEAASFTLTAPPVEANQVLGLKHCWCDTRGVYGSSMSERLRMGESVYDSASFGPMGSVYQRGRIFYTSPATGVDWTKNEVTSVQPGFVSTNGSNKVLGTFVSIAYTPPLTQTWQLSGAAAGTSQLVGALRRTAALSGSASGDVLVEASLCRIAGMTGSTAGSDSASARLTLIRALSGAAAGVSQILGQLTRFLSGLAKPLRFVVPRDHRTFFVSAEDRTFPVPLDHRTFCVAAEERTFPVLFERRIFHVNPTRSHIMETISKDTAANKPYGFDWSAFLEDGDKIVASEWSTGSGLTLSAQSFTDTATTVWVGGGALGKRYVVTNSITTESGITDSRSFTVSIQQQ